MALIAIVSGEPPVPASFDAAASSRDWTRLASVGVFRFNVRAARVTLKGNGSRRRRTRSWLIREAAHPPGGTAASCKRTAGPCWA